MKTVSASDANRHFSSLLREVAAGKTITIASRSRPVATLSPAHKADDERGAARRRLVERLQKQKPTGHRNWTRDELY
jgi:prevent-host-death family protein